MKKQLLTLAAASLFAGGAVAAEEDAPSNEELYEIIQAQQEKLEAMDRGEGGSGLGDTTLGGYGELHYNNRDEGDDAIDFHRFVLFLGHEYNDDVRFFSELEVEHSYSGDGKPGAVELEQAYVEFDLSDTTSAKGGLFLVPVGILNPTHEPNTFYGVERNPVEKNIIPTTWWEGGAAIGGHFANGVSYDLAVHSGLETLDGNPGLTADDFNIRGGRQKVAKATANDLALTGRLKYTGIAGLELASTVNYQQDITQGKVAGAETSAVLTEAHAIYEKAGFSARALFARWDLDSTAAEAAGKDVQDGFYVESGYKFTRKFGIFARYNEWDTGGLATETAISQTDVGVNYWPIEDVVVKVDYATLGKAGDGDTVNIGIGYQF